MAEVSICGSPDVGLVVDMVPASEETCKGRTMGGLRKGYRDPTHVLVGTQVASLRT